MVVTCSAEARVLHGDGGVSPNLTLSSPPRRATSQWLETDITIRLNDALSDRGVVVRTPDFLKNDGPKPATLWRSDIYPPNQVYMNAGFAKPYIGYAVDPDWWDAVVLYTFYPHDSNSCDAVQPGGTEPVYGRCFWDDSGSVWNCPGAYISDTGDMWKDTSAVGASANDCRGCHFNWNYYYDWHLDQDFDDAGDYDCNCPDMDYSEDQVCEWVQSELVDSGRLYDPLWAADAMTCWVDDVVALRNLQNCYYWKYYGANWDAAMYEWAGWNEIGAAEEVDDPLSWQAIMIYLPAQLANMGLADLDPSMQQEVQNTILDFYNNGGLVIGAQHVTERPGSYVVMANEFKDDDAANPNFYHYFFCQSWTPDVPNPQIQVCFLAWGDDPNGNGYCYLEWSGVPCM
jgi:hypothetical protein